MNILQQMDETGAGKKVRFTEAEEVGEKLNLLKESRKNFEEVQEKRISHILQQYLPAESTPSD